MRQTIESAPKNQEDIILEDDASGTFDVAHWSPEADKWISENGKPSKITPTHWHPLPQDQSLQRSSPSRIGRARFRLATFSITGAVILAGLYFIAEAPIWGTRNVHQEAVGAGATGTQAGVQKTPETKQANSRRRAAKSRPTQHS
jgi:hypothetical protein